MLHPTWAISKFRGCHGPGPPPHSHTVTTILCPAQGLAFHGVLLTPVLVQLLWVHPLPPHSSLLAAQRLRCGIPEPAHSTQPLTPTPYFGQPFCWWGCGQPFCCEELQGLGVASFLFFDLLFVNTNSWSRGCSWLVHHLLSLAWFLLAFSSLAVSSSVQNKDPFLMCIISLIF